MQLFYQPALSKGHLFLDPDESRHCIRVLRKNTGDQIDLTDGIGAFYKAEITDNNPRKCEFKIISSRKIESPDIYIHIAVAPTKNMDRMEWMVEKCTELGVNEISFFISSNSERTILKSERLVKKAVSAMKQSMQAYLPIINEAVPFSDFINSIESHVEKFIAFVDPNNPVSLFQAVRKNKEYCILIGPEGDFTQPELKSAQAKSFKKVNLGEKILRTETAGIVACTTLHLMNS